MKEYFITEGGDVVVCSKIQAIILDTDTIYADDTYPIIARLEGFDIELCTVVEDDAQTKIEALVKDIFEVDLPGYPTHGGKAPGGPLEG